MHAPSTTDQGLAFFTSYAAGAGAARRQAPRRNADVIGWVAPTDIYQEMRNIEAAASNLDGLVRQNVADPQFVSGWSTWLAAWRAFFAPYKEEGAANSQKAAAVFHSDELKAQTDSYWTQLAAWQRSYQGQVDATGRRVPPVPAPLAVIAPTPSQLEQQRDAKSGWTLPWWAWTALGLTVAGVGVWGYFAAKKMLAMRRAIDQKVLPAVLTTYAGPHVGGALAEAATAHDQRRADPLALERYVGRSDPGPGRMIAPPVTFERANDFAYTLPPEPKVERSYGRGRRVEAEDLYDDYED